MRRGLSGSKRAEDIDSMSNKSFALIIPPILLISYTLLL